MGSLADLCASEVITQKIDKAYEEGYNKAIDEMVDGIREILECNAIYNIDCISTLAEQMKGGAE